MIWKGAWSSSWEDLTNQPISRQTYGRGQWRQNCVRSPRAGSTFRIRSWSYKEWVHHLYNLFTPKWLHFAFQRPISYFLTLSNQNLCPCCNTGGEVSLQAESWKTPTLKPLRSKHLWLSGKKRTLKYQNKMSFQISLCHRSKIIVNQTEWEFTQRRGEGEGEFLTVPVCLEIKSYEKIPGELQNTCKNEKENKKQLSVQSRVKRLIQGRSRILSQVRTTHQMPLFPPPPSPLQCPQRYCKPKRYS